MFDRKCLFFNGYTEQTVMESPTEKHRVRHVKITYFLVDDTINVVEPIVEVQFLFYFIEFLFTMCNFLNGKISHQKTESNRHV